MGPLEKEFDNAVRNQITTILQTTNYRPTYYMEMVHRHGAYQAAVDLVRASQPPAGFTRLYEMARLDLTVEALVIEPRFVDLFSQEDRDSALARLRKYGYKVQLGSS